MKPNNSAFAHLLLPLDSFAVHNQFFKLDHVFYRDYFFRELTFTRFNIDCERDLVRIAIRTELISNPLVTKLSNHLNQLGATKAITYFESDALIWVDMPSDVFAQTLFANGTNDHERIAYLLDVVFYVDE